MSSSIPCQPPLFPEQVCTVCGRSLPLEEFYVRDKRTGRRFSWCKDDHKAKSRQYYASHKEEHKASVLAWAKEHPKQARDIHKRSVERNRERINDQARARNASPEGQAKRKAYREANAERIKAQDAEYRKRRKESIDAYNAAYREAHREEMAEAARRSRAKKPEYYNGLSRAWKAQHPQERISHTHKRRAILRGMPGVVTAFEWERIKAQHNWCCVDCGLQERSDGIVLCRDHIIPLNPGFNIAANIAPRCRSCNSKKHRRLLRRRP